MRGYSLDERVRAAQARGRDYRDDYTAAQQEAARQNKEAAMKRRKTALGDQVVRFPDVGNRDARIAEVRQALAEAFEKAEAARSLQERMGNTKTVDDSRFSVLGDGS